MENPDVSVIIPCYNQGAYVASCLDSVLSQTLQNIEVLCIDDGSTDETPEILRAYAHKDSRVNVYAQKNAGAASCRNRALSIAKGTYVIFCDSDDTYPDPMVLEKLFKAAESHNAPAAAGSYSIYFEDTDTLSLEFDGIFWGQAFKKEGLVRYVDYQFDYGFTRFLFRLDVLRASGVLFPTYTRFEDPPFLVRVLFSMGSFYAIPDIVYRARVGYKIVDWNPQTQVGLLKGLADNLRFSREHRLANLHELTLRRLEEEYGGVYHWAIRDNGIFSALVHANGEVDESLLSDEYCAAHRVDGLFMLAPLMQQAAFGQVWERDVVRLESDLEREQCDNARLRGEVECLTGRLNAAEARVDEMENSTIWKVGSAVTALPRRIVDETRKRKSETTA